MAGGHGGRRPGAGRPEGARNKRTLLLREALRESGASLNDGGQAPLEFLIAVMRNEKLDLPIRVDAAKAACPYLHPKLNMVEARVGVHQATSREISATELDAILGSVVVPALAPPAEEEEHDAT